MSHRNSKVYAVVHIVAMIFAAGLGMPEAALAAPVQAGDIVGRITRSEGTGIAGVLVSIDETGAETFTDAEGQYTFENVPEGTYNISLVLGHDSIREPNVTVTAGAVTSVERAVDWAEDFYFSVTVTAASRRPERIVDAPGSVSTLGSTEIEQQAAHGQLPRLLSSMAGVDLVQSGLFDFNPNSRGFNTMNNRRLLTTIDGRDPSVPILLGYQEWASMPFLLDELETVEFVRGPGGALYGAGAVNGVLNLRTKPPRESLGGKIRLSAGQLSSQRYEVRHSGALGREWFYRVLGGYHQSGTFTRSRVDGVEYAPESLPTEIVPLPSDRTRIGFGSLRFDKHFGRSKVAVFEGGSANLRGLTTVTSAGRSFTGNTNRPWARFSLTATNWNVLGYYTGSNANGLVGLSSGAVSYNESHSTGGEFQKNGHFSTGKGRLVGGVSYSRQAADSSNPSGRQTLFSETVRANNVGVFGQVDYQLHERLRAVFSGRWDESSLHDAIFSPRGALVYSMTDGQVIRFTASRGFQGPTLVTYFLDTPVAPPLDLSLLEQSLAPVLGGVPLGFENIPLLALGNENLLVETVRSIEFGYNAVIATNTYLNASYYWNRLANFTSNLLPQVGTPVGRINPDYGPYQTPAGLTPQAAALVNATLGAVLPPELLVSLSNRPDGSPIFALLSFGSFGRADAQGVEIGITHALGRRWKLDSNYSFFDYKIKVNAPQGLVANSPKHQAKAGVVYLGSRLDASFRYRWNDGFLWSSGLFVGPVPAYGVADLNVAYRLSRRWTAGLDFANVFNNGHYEMFGGDVLKQRLVGSVTLSW